MHFKMFEYSITCSFLKDRSAATRISQLARFFDIAIKYFRNRLCILYLFQLPKSMLIAVISNAVMWN